MGRASIRSAFGDCTGRIRRFVAKDTFGINYSKTFQSLRSKTPKPSALDPPGIRARFWSLAADATTATLAESELMYAVKRDFNRWLDSLGDASGIDTLTELMAFNLANAGNNAIKYGQTRFDISEEMNLVADAARYAADRAKDIFLTATHGIDEVMAAQDLDALLFGGASSADLAARPGYPNPAPATMKAPSERLNNVLTP